MKAPNNKPPSPAASTPSSSASLPPTGPTVTPLALLPLRFFLGCTFLYAGIQKLTDPTFFAATGNGSIARQLAGYADVSPLGGFITAVVLPHATLFGGLVAWGEVAIGLGTIAGILYRPAAFFGSLLSLVLWLTATWEIKPYFYGADIFALFGWVTLTLAGTSGLLTLEPLVAARLWPISQKMLGAERTRYTYTLLGWPLLLTTVAPYSESSTGTQTIDRRHLLQGFAAGIAALVTGAGIWSVLRSTGSDSAAVAVTPTATAIADGSTEPTATVASGNATVIGNLQSLAANSAVKFTPPNTTDVGILVRLPNGNVAAYNTSCTHAGCEVRYSTSSKLLICPCHDAEFDPARAAKVVQGPARTPLQEYPITVDSQSGTITFTA